MKIVRLLDDVANTERDVKCPKGGFRSFRFLLAKDGMGFSVHRTFIPRGEPQFWHYKSHLEACYCVSGIGKIINLATNEEHYIDKDTLYALDSHDPHTFQAIEDVVLISIFNPPVTGQEVHKEDGSYEVTHE